MGRNSSRSFKNAPWRTRLFVWLAVPSLVTAVAGVAGASPRKIEGGVPLYFHDRPSTDGTHRLVRGAKTAPVTIRFASAVTAADLEEVRRAGALLRVRRDGSTRGGKNF